MEFLVEARSIANMPTSLSYMEQRLIIAKILWHNDIQMAGSNEVWDPAGDHKHKRVFTNWAKDPLYVKLTPRKV
jgi:hypothetical protein